MLTTTVDQLTTHNVIQYLGVVSGSAIIGGEERGILAAALGAAADGIPAPYERLEREARLRAMDLMREQAELVGGQAIIGLQIKHEVLDASRQITLILALGTAVKLQGW